MLKVTSRRKRCLSRFRGDAESRKVTSGDELRTIQEQKTISISSDEHNNATHYDYTTCAARTPVRSPISPARHVNTHRLPDTSVLYVRTARSPLRSPAQLTLCVFRHVPAARTLPAPVSCRLSPALCAVRPETCPCTHHVLCGFSLPHRAFLRAFCCFPRPNAPPRIIYTVIRLCPACA